MPTPINNDGTKKKAQDPFYAYGYGIIAFFKL